MIFRKIGGIWTDAGTNSVLADVLAKYDIVIDDRCQFARLYDYDRGILFYYRASAGCVKLTLMPLNHGNIFCDL